MPPRFNIALNVPYGRRVMSSRRCETATMNENILVI